MKSESAADEVEVGKRVFARLIGSCCQELSIIEPVTNWAIEYDRAATRYIAFLFFGDRIDRFQLDAVELVSLQTNPGLQETITLKFLQTMDKSLESAL